MSQRSDHPDHAQDAIDSTQAALDESREVEPEAAPAGAQPVPVPIPVAPPGALPDTLLDATNELSKRVTTLSENLVVSMQQQRNTRYLAIGGIVALIFLSLFGYSQWDRSRQAIEGNTEVSVQSCRNANETRAANLQLWTYILDLSAQTNPENASNLALFKEWVGILYQPHDCSDLAKVYKIPPPPTMEPVPSPEASPAPSPAPTQSS